MPRSSDAPASPLPANGSAPADVLDLSVVIVNYNVREFLEQALRSVERASAGLRVEVFVVDNNSVDGSVEMVRTRFPEVRVIANEENVGFGRANNQAIRQARGRHLLILNPDTIVQEDTFSTLLGFMAAHPEAGAVGCRILNPDGTFAPESRRTFPTPAVAFYRMTGLGRLFPKSRRFGRYNLSYLSPDAVAEVDALSGSCMLVRHAALYADRDEGRGDDETLALLRNGNDPSAVRNPPSAIAGAGLFDEDYFMYGEDLDWCFRIQEAGWKIFYTPDTQIIHYKGESTKKGELRYVRHFYGAMLLFTEKHFEDRYSQFFAGALRAAIMLRAGLTVLTTTLRRLAAPLADFALVFALVTLVGAVRSAMAGAVLVPLFFLTVAPGYALGTVAGIGLAGGYRQGGRTRIRPVLVGTALGLLVVAAGSFFVKDIAFSRVIVGVAYPVLVLALTAWRFARYRRAAGARRAVLVGRAEEAVRLRDTLSAHPQPPFHLLGYVTPEKQPPPPASGPNPPDADADAEAAPPRLGTLHHLRDLVRLRRIDDVVFVPDDLAHGTIFGLMQQLRDLPVQFRMLARGQGHIIGKASIDDLAAPPLVEAEAAVGTLRPRAARRAFEVPLALAGLLAHPFIALAARLGGPRSFAARLAARTRRLPAVLAGRLALIGVRPEDLAAPPPEWELPPGLFAITDTLATPTPDADACQRAYWFYLSRQSASLDWDILVRSLRNLYTENP